MKEEVESEQRMFEANCSRQMCQHKKKIFHQMFLCLHGGVTKVHVSDTSIFSPPPFKSMHIPSQIYLNCYTKVDCISIIITEEETTHHCVRSSGDLRM